MTHKKDLIEEACKGAGKRFAEVVCEFFLNDDNRNCRLLKEEPFERIFENGRCEPRTMLEQSIAYHLDEYRDRLDQSLLAKKIFHKRILLGLLEVPGNNLKNQKLKKGSFNLFTLRRYLNTCVQREVSTLLREEGIFPDFECGNCVFYRYKNPMSVSIMKLLAERYHIMMKNEGPQIEPVTISRTILRSSVMIK